MSRLANFVRGIASPFVDDSPPTESEKRARVRQRRRERYNSPDRANKAKRGKSTRKDDEDDPIDRLVTVNEDVRDNIRGNARSKPYDPVFLRDISANAVVQAYVDTLSQDVSSTEWSIKPRDEDADISDEALAKVERHLKELPPGNQTFADLLEATTRVLLELGDAAVVKHYYKKSNRLAELVPVDSASLFKLVDKHGIPEGYVQISKQGGKKVDEFGVDDVIWAEWSNRPDRFYGQGPLEKAQNEVELIEELAEKERLDLIQGGPPGVLSPEALDEYGGLPNDEDWETFVEEMRLDAGERHRVGYSKVPVNFEAVNHNYQELQILDRSKYWVTVIGSVFKVNPSYAGFDFENVNRATDESQRESFKQRGFRVTLRQLEEALNRGLIWSDISDDIKFEFTKEQTVEERRDRASLIEDQATAGKEMANAGRDVSIRDGRLVVEDGEIEEGDVGGGGGGGGGLFGSVDDPDDADVSIEARKDDDGVRLQINTDHDHNAKAEVPDNAVSISDPSEAPEGARTVTGPGGGDYYIPPGESSGGQATIDDIMSSDMSEEEKKSELSNAVVDETGIEEADLSNFDTNQAEDVSRALVSVSEYTDGILKVGSSPTEEMAERKAAGNYDPFSQEIQLDPESITNEQASEWADQGFIAGDSVEHLVAHEVGHHNHFQNEVDGQSSGMAAQVEEIPDDSKAAIADTFSAYAATNANELVAEAFAVKVTGGDVPTGIQNGYEQFGGPEL